MNVNLRRRDRVGVRLFDIGGDTGIARMGIGGGTGTRALPFATSGCPFGANDLCPKGAIYDSPGHRPGFTATQNFQALKGRPNR
jgi:hypothetical protein